MLLFFYKNGFGIKRPIQFDMQLNKETKRLFQSGHFLEFERSMDFQVAFWIDKPVVLKVLIPSSVMFLYRIAPFDVTWKAKSVEYTDCFSAEG